jgi:hypothetical protein
MRCTVFAACLPLCLLAAVPSHARTATAAERRACEEEVQEKIDTIDSKLRSGYSAREGEKLRERRRKLEVERAKCREAR